MERVDLGFPAVMNVSPRPVHSMDADDYGLGIMRMLSKSSPDQNTAVRPIRFRRGLVIQHGRK
jgi:hypothetical protein